jgi:ketosteroid isomerase-like protein
VIVRTADANEWSKKMTLDHQRAQRFAETWYAAWNSHDLAAILDHYADDVEMASPLVSRFAGREDGRIAGKDALSTYFAAGLEAYPALHFEPIDLFVGVDSLVLHYRGAGGNLAAEVVFLDSRDKITRYVAHYTLA